MFKNIRSVSLTIPKDTSNYGSLDSLYLKDENQVNCSFSGIIKITDISVMVTFTFADNYKVKAIVSVPDFLDNTHTVDYIFDNTTNHWKSAGTTKNSYLVKIDFENSVPANYLSGISLTSGTNFLANSKVTVLFDDKQVLDSTIPAQSKTITLAPDISSFEIPRMVKAVQGSDSKVFMRVKNATI